MKYLLDTNVVSELARRMPDDNVVRWFSSVEEDALFLSAPVVGELVFGVSKLEDGVQKDRYTGFVRKIRNRFGNRVLIFDNAMAEAWGRLRGALARRGKTLPMIDSMIAAMALVHGMTVVTRNTRDFETAGVSLYNPFKTAQEGEK